MHRIAGSSAYRQAYLVACAAALVLGFAAGIAVIPAGVLQEDRMDLRTLATYFFHSGNVDTRQLASGWLAPGLDGTWSSGQGSVLLIDLNYARDRDLELEFVFSPFFAKQHRRQNVQVTVNDHLVGSWGLKAPMRQRIRSVNVARSVWTARRPARIGFQYANPRSPAELGVPGGADPLAIQLSSLVIRLQR